MTEKLMIEEFPYRLRFVNANAQLLVDAWFRTREIAEKHLALFGDIPRPRGEFGSYRFDDDAGTTYSVTPQHVSVALIADLQKTHEMQTMLNTQFGVIGERLEREERHRLDATSGTVGFARSQ